MPKRAHTSQYYADDKDIYDLLLSAKRSFDEKTMVAIARKRGICLSQQTPRAELVEYIARLMWSWPQIEQLLEVSHPPERREKLTSRRVSTAADLAAVRAAVEEVQGPREKDLDEVYEVKEVGDKKLVVTVHYSEFEPGRTRLHQRPQRDVQLEIEKSDNGYKVRHQANDRGREIASAVLAKLAATAEPNEAEVTLQGITAPEKRIKFFIDLMSKLEGYELRNVTAVSVDRLPTVEADDGESIPEDEIEDAPKDSATAEAASMLGVVRKAALEGESLLESKAFEELKKQGFFLSRTVWRSREKKADGIEVEFEADFEDAKNCTGFRYNVLGMYERRSRGEEGIKKTRSAVPPDMRVQFVRLLEDAAQAALSAVAPTTDVPAVKTTAATGTDGRGGRST